ncbi:MAG: DUF2845 domain-containing protein [Legionellales bacterium]|nr:DUF2845 domain-containing protein [Legionellales bacterium]
MKNLLKVGIASVALLSQSMLWAQMETFYCPTGGQYANKGMSEAQVIAACGEPDAKQLLDEPAMQQEKVEEIIYALPIENLYEYNRIMNPKRGGGGYIPISFTILKNKVVSIEVDDDEVESTSLCQRRGVQVKIGDTRRRVISLCGNPSFTNKTTRSIPLGDGNVPVSIWTYDFGPYQPKAYMRFIGEKLDSIVER